MANVQSLQVYNCQAVDLSEIPLLSIADFRNCVIQHVKSGCRISSLFGRPLNNNNVRILAVLANDEAGTLFLSSADVEKSYLSLTTDCPQAHWFEREIAEQWGITPTGHPWLKPIRFHSSYSKGYDTWGRKSADQIMPGVTNYFQVTGEEIHEVAVGPVHAGVIEPGHFRFQCHGEDVFNLEISLGYQHRGIEHALIASPNKRTIHYMETAAGDTTIGHTTAYCQILEALCDCNVPARAQVLRAIALELERLANHTGDLGALAGDIGYLPTASFCGRIRGDFLNMTAIICGNRFGRGIIRPGGAGCDVEEKCLEELKDCLARAAKDVTVAVNLLWSTPSVVARFEETGVLSRQICTDLGLVGVTARACGIDRDCRFNFPSGIYQFAQVPVSTWHSGDVFSRAYVRWLEIQKSLAFINNQLEMLPQGQIAVPIDTLSPEKFVVSLVEGWRGEICHVALTGSDGRFSNYKIVDPSFHNWMGLSMALREQQISDFPLCNKSFNLSYCGHDL
jgi:Ni,Fe-hydrogenase III large subunit